MGKDIYEIESMRMKVKWDLPAHIGFFVYKYAKLRMLQYYYDFYVQFVEKSNFELSKIDTAFI